MRGVFLALLLLPSPAAALVIEYELDPGLCVSDELGSQACTASSVRDGDGAGFSALAGRIAVEVLDGESRLIGLSVRTPGLQGLSGGLLFGAELLPESMPGALDLLVTVRRAESAHALDLDPRILAADLDRLDFIAGLTPSVMVEATCRIVRLRPPGGRFPSLTCDEAREEPDVIVIDIPERELVELRIVAVPVPEPAAVLLLALGTGLVGAARRSRASME